MRTEVKNIETVKVRNGYRAMKVNGNTTIYSFMTNVEIGSPISTEIHYTFTSEKFRNKFTSNLENFLESLKDHGNLTLIFKADSVVGLNQLDKRIGEISYNALYKEDLSYSGL